MKNLFKQIKDLYRIDPFEVVSGKVYHKTKFDIFMERMTQIYITFAIICFITIAIRLIF